MTCDFNSYDFKLLLPVNQKLGAKATKYIPKYWERSVKKKPKLNFIRIIKNSSPDQHFVYM